MNSNLAYLLGYHVGDGSLRRRTIQGRKYSYEWCLYFNARDIGLANNVASRITQEFDILPRVKRRGNCIEMHVYSKEVVERIHTLVELPYGRKVEIAHIPKSIWKSDPNLKKSFLSGLVDAEFGLVWKDEIQRKRATTLSLLASFASRRLARDTVRLIQEVLGLNVRYYRVKRYDKRMGAYTEHQVRVSGRSAELLYQHLHLENPHLIEKYGTFVKAKRASKFVFWQPFEVKKLKDLVCAGASLKDICQKTGRSKTAVFRKIREVKPEIEVEFSKIDWVARITLLIDRYNTIEQASRAVGLDRHVLPRLLKETGSKKFKMNNKRRITLTKILNFR